MANGFYIFVFFIDSCSESGDENLFLTLSTRLSETLSNQTVKWQRTYSRESHVFNLNVKIFPLNPALLECTDLVTRPYFHIFWTDCNVCIVEFVCSLLCEQIHCV